MIASQRWWRVLAGLVLCAAFWGLPAREASAAVTCSGTMSILNFGDVDLLNGGGTPTNNARLDYTCKNDQDEARWVRVCFNIGDGSASIASGGGHWTPRILRTSQGDELQFQLYQNAGATTIWGSTTQPPVPDAYDVGPLQLPKRINLLTPSTTTGTYTMYGKILTGQAGSRAGLYQSDFTGNHTALRFAVANSAGAVPANCNSATTDGGIFGFSVRVNVVKSCQVSADPLDFGSVTGVGAPLPIDAQSAIQVTCSTATGYSLALVPSNSNTAGSSAMKGQTSGNTGTVAYRLYRDASRNNPWGSVTGTGGNTVASTGTGASQSFPVYGRVPTLPNVRPDDYKDTVTVNVIY